MAVMATAAWAQAPAKAPAVKDQGEYDLTAAVQKEADPQKKLDLLNQWEQKYPESDYKTQRTLMTMQTESALAMKAMQPNAPAGDQDAGQKAARHLIENSDKYFADDNKPAGATADQWKEAKMQIGVQAHTALATVAMAKKTPATDAAAEGELKKVLEIAPMSASTSYTLGTLILRQRKIERYPEALYLIARATTDTGPLALVPAGKKAAEDYLKKAYIGYHGSDEGLEELMKASVASPLPPADFKIRSITDIEKEKEGDAAAFAAANPDIAFWRTIKAALTAADGGAAYFEQIKGSEIPPADSAYKMFRAKVVAQNSPKELLVNVDNIVGDATLQFENPLKGTVEAGTAFKFKGVIESFVKDPYMVTFTGLAKEDTDGLPATAFVAAPAAKPAVRRPPVTKKKK